MTQTDFDAKVARASVIMKLGAETGRTSEAGKANKTKNEQVACPFCGTGGKAHRIAKHFRTCTKIPEGTKLSESAIPAEVETITADAD